MVAPILFLVTSPPLAELTTWAAGNGFPATVACGMLLIFALICLIRVAARQWRANGFDRADTIFLTAFSESPHVLSIFQEGAEFRASPRWQVYHAGCRELAFHLLGSDRVEKNFASRLRAAGSITSSQMNAVLRAMERAAGEISLDYLAVTTPAASAASAIRWTGLFLGMALFVEASRHPIASPGAFPHWVVPVLLPGAVSIVLSLMVSASADSLLRRIFTAAARIRLYPAELAIMIERAFVNHGVQSTELPSVAALGEPVSQGFSFPPAEPFPSVVR